MADGRYVSVLKRAYFLEAIGEAAYRRGSRRMGNGIGSERWADFAETEARMQRLIHDELRRLQGDWKPTWVNSFAVGGLGCLARLVRPSLLTVLIRRVLDRRRYTRWAAEFHAHNPHLWETLVEHELRQVDHFERRGT